MNAIQDFAERVRKFYYYRALLCERLINKEIHIAGYDYDVEMPPIDFDPFRNLYVDAYVLACAAIDGLASIWSLLSHTEITGKNRDRFISFLINLDTRNQMERICTPFLVFFLEKQGVEEPFTEAIKVKWLKNRSEQASHPVYHDPIFSELKTIYEECYRLHPLPDSLSLKSPDSVIQGFTYASLIYKYYRCSFIHEFRSSKYAIHFNQRSEISIREIGFDISPSDEKFEVKGTKPQLDIGIGVLTDSIRKGADVIHAQIIENRLVNIPYSVDEFTFSVKQKPKNRN